MYQFFISNPNFYELLYNSRRLKNLNFTPIPSSHLLYIMPHHRNHYTQNIFPTKPIHKILSQISTFNLVQTSFFSPPPRFSFKSFLT